MRRLHDYHFVCHHRRAARLRRGPYLEEGDPDDAAWKELSADPSQAFNIGDLRLAGSGGLKQGDCKQPDQTASFGSYD